jgi:hypothetical protein
MPRKLWFVGFDITTHKGRVLRRAAKVSDPCRHYAEYLKRFYPTAKRVEWWPTDEQGKEIGPHRSVEFDEKGLVTVRDPDDDLAQAGGTDWKPDPKNPFKAGMSRKGVDPADLASRSGAIPGSEDDTVEVEPNVYVPAAEAKKEGTTPVPGEATPTPTPVPGDAAKEGGTFG